MTYTVNVRQRFNNIVELDIVRKQQLQIQILDNCSRVNNIP